MLSIRTDARHPLHSPIVADGRLTGLTPGDVQDLSELARHCVLLGIDGRPAFRPMVDYYSPALRKEGATFVSLRCGEQLLSRVGTVVADVPLLSDLCHNAYEAGSRVLGGRPTAPFAVEIQLVHPLQPIAANSLETAASALEPGSHGVWLKSGSQHATFTPDMWHKWPDTTQFLQALHAQLGLSTDEWARDLQLATYRVDHLPVIEVECGARLS